MSAEGLASAQIEKARHARRVEVASVTTLDRLGFLRDKVAAGSGPGEAAMLKLWVMEAYAHQIDLVIEAAQIDHNVETQRVAKD